jgi:hypothetical protein
MSGIAGRNPALPSCSWTYRHHLIEAINMRHALINFWLLDQAARDGAIARADAEERLEHQAQAKLRAKPAETGRVVTLARRRPRPGDTDHLTAAGRN